MHEVIKINKYYYNEKQNLQKELYPILENESIQIGSFKANRSIDTLDIIKENIKFWQNYDGHKLPEKQAKRAYYNGTRTQKHNQNVHKYARID